MRCYNNRLSVLNNTREIIYRLLLGEQGGRLRHLVAQGGYADRIARAVERIRNDFDKPLRIDGLARELGMSTSGLHFHFKAVTALSPLQFQKQIRLQEARRLMTGKDLDAATAGYRVGYEDPSHFQPGVQAAGRRTARARCGAPPRCGSRLGTDGCRILRQSLTVRAAKDREARMYPACLHRGRRRSVRSPFPAPQRRLRFYPGLRFPATSPE